MSDTHDQLIDLDTSRADAAARADHLRTWLTSSGWIGLPYPDGYSDVQGATAFTLGPAALAQFPTFHHASIEITSSGTIWMTDGNPEAPVCTECGTEDDQYWEAIEGWAETGVEPVGECESCGFTAPYGDWKIDNTPLGGSVGVMVYFASEEISSDDVTSALLADLRSIVGGRWARTQYHL